MFNRSPHNPLCTPAQVAPSQPGLEVIGTFNPAATLHDGRILLLIRVAEKARPDPGCVAAPVVHPESGDLEILQFPLDHPGIDVSDPRAFTVNGEIFLTSISHFRRAIRLPDGGLEIDPLPVFSASGPYESYGVEDARIVLIDGSWLVTYTATSPHGVCTSLATTTDFQHFERKGLLFGPDNKDVVIFPERTGGRHTALHRPATKHLGTPSIWLATSDNLLDWGQHQFVFGPRPGYWDSERVGAGTSPIKTPEGWLLLYHGADHNIRYCLGAALLDLHQPWRVLARSSRPIFEPEETYETKGFMPDVVFHNGTVLHDDGTLEIFYGGADAVTCSASTQLSTVMEALR